MGLLDELKARAEAIKTGETDEQRAEQERERRYREEILPRMEYIYGYLTELAKHLNLILPDVYMRYDLFGKARTPELKQTAYEISVDSRENMTRIDFEIICEADGETGFDVEGKKNIDTIREQLIGAGIKFEFKVKMDELVVAQEGRFLVKNRVPARLSFIAEPENGRIVLQIRNFDDLGRHRLNLQPAQITEEMMERFGRYILREMHDFLQMEISEEDRRHIQEMLEKDRQRREMEMREAEWREAVERARLEKERNNRLIMRVKRNLAEKTEKLGSKLTEKLARLIKR